MKEDTNNREWKWKKGRRPFDCVYMYRELKIKFNNNNKTLTTLMQNEVLYQRRSAPPQLMTK